MMAASRTACAAACPQTCSQCGQDHKNPTVDALAAWRKDMVTFTSGELSEDVATILGATHVALAGGTFAWMLALLGNAQVHKAQVPRIQAFTQMRDPCARLQNLRHAAWSLL